MYTAVKILSCDRYHEHSTRACRLGRLGTIPPSLDVEFERDGIPVVALL